MSTIHRLCRLNNRALFHCDKQGSYVIRTWRFWNFRVSLRYADGNERKIFKLDMHWWNRAGTNAKIWFGMSTSSSHASHIPPTPLYKLIDDIELEFTQFMGAHFHPAAHYDLYTQEIASIIRRKIQSTNMNIHGYIFSSDWV